MKKHFYTHLVDITTIHTELDTLPLQKHEKEELISIAHSTIHHVIIETVLSELSDEEIKKKFLKHVTEEQHETVWDMLKDNVEDIEDKIKVSIENLKKELHQDIADAKKE